MRIAYLVGRYPAVSHTFIQREVIALRERGVEVNTISIRRADPDDVLSDADRREAASTFAVLPIAFAQLLRTHLTTLATRPLGYLRALRAALRLARPGIRGLVWELFYFAEAIVVWDHCRQLGLRHIHVHHLNQASDVAMLALEIQGNGPGRWTWSYTMHGPDEFANVLDFRLEPKAISAAAIACISDFARAQVMPLIPTDEWRKLHVIHCGLLVEQWQPPASRPRENGPLRIVFVGRMVPVKGQQLLLAAMTELRERGTETEAVFVGDGPIRADLERWAVKHDLSAHVRFTGSVGQDPIAEIYASSDVFVLPSSAEGVPVVLMEAMAMELPVITTEVAGIPELVEHDVSGFVVSPGRSDLLADALERLAADPRLRAELGRRGRQKVLSQYDARQSAAQLEKMFAEILDA